MPPVTTPTVDTEYSVVPTEPSVSTLWGGTSTIHTNKGIQNVTETEVKEKTLTT